MVEKIAKAIHKAYEIGDTLNGTLQSENSKLLKGAKKDCLVSDRQMCDRLHNTGGISQHGQRRYRKTALQ
jgi:hypothetical protein